MNDHKMSLKRPSRKDDENDILKMQEEFLSSQNSPSAKVQRVAKETPKSKGPGPDVTSRSQIKSEKESSSEIVDFTDYTTDIPVLLAISEKNIGQQTASAPMETRIAFPRPFKLDAISRQSGSTRTGGQRGQSLFAQQMRKKANQNAPVLAPDPTLMEATTALPSSLFDNPGAWVGHGAMANQDVKPTNEMDIKDIQEENEAKIAAMSAEEIRQYQEQLVGHLGQDVVNFVRKRHKKITKKQETSKDMDVNSDSTASTHKSRVTFKETTDRIPATKAAEIVPEDLILPIDPEEARKWPHMEKIQYDKLAWMSRLPAPKPLDPKTGHTARFDFNGFLMAHDEDVPVQKGLHHHGEEPEVAGYTIEEIFHLSRSSLSSQRIIALQTLAKVLHNSNLGLFDKCLNIKLVPRLLDAGVIFLMRMALDESQLDATSAAIYALHELVVSELDEACLDFGFPWQCGHISPFMVSQEEKMMTQDETKEMPDTEIVKDDVIEGLLRMDILPRLRYILEVMRPDDRTIVKRILGILTRIARHSLQASSQIMDCPRLVKAIFDNFIPVHWSKSSNSDRCYGLPLPSALKLVRCIVSAGRHLAKRLMHDFNLSCILNAYIASDSSDPSLSLVRLEALRTWKILLSYGFASETWTDLFPVLMGHYQHCQGLDLIGSTHTADLHYSSLLLTSLQSLLFIAGSRSRDTSTVVDWNQVENVYSLVSSLAQKWLREITVSGMRDLTIGVSTLSAAVNLLTTFFQLKMIQSNVNTVEISNNIRNLWKKSIEQFLESADCLHFAKNLGLQSSLVSSTSPGTDRNAPNLPFLGAAQFGGMDISPSTKEGTVVPLFAAILGFARLAARMHCLSRQSVDFVLNMFSSYTKSVVACKTLRSSWFVRQELYLLHSLVHLATSTMKVEKGSFQEDTTVVYHQVALLLPSLMCNSENYLIEELFTDVLFHPVFYSEEAKLSAQMMTLQTEEDQGLVSVTGQSLELSEGLVLKDTFASLPSIRNLYLELVHTLPQLHNCRSIWRGNFVEVQSLSVEWKEGERVFSSDWPLLPIKVAYSRKIKASKPGDRSEEPVEDPEGSALKIRACLLWLHYLVLTRRDMLSWSSDSAGHIFVHLCSVFLISDDLFLSPQVQPVLYCLLRRFFIAYKTEHLCLESLQKPSPFLSFYEELVSHFDSTSYGDRLFASVILVPLQQKYSWHYRQMLLTEHFSVLKLLTLPLNQMLVPLEQYLYPLEDQLPLLRMYMKLLQSGLLERCPLIQAMATHHLHHYIFSAQSEEHRKELITVILRNRNKASVSAVLLYKNVNPSTGVQVESELPMDRRDFLRKTGFSDV